MKLVAWTKATKSDKEITDIYESWSECMDEENLETYSPIHNIAMLTNHFINTTP